MGSALFHLLARLFVGNVEVAVTDGSLKALANASIIAERYRAGESQEAIARSLGLSRDVIRRVLKQLGIPLHPANPVSGPHRQTILTMHAEGRTVKQISDDLGLNLATVYSVLRRADGVQKKRGSSG